MTTTTIAERLSALIEIAGVGHEEVDNLAGLWRGHTNKIARGVKPSPTATTVNKLARVLGTDAEYLADGIGSAPSERRVRASVRSARQAVAATHEPERATKSAPRKGTTSRAGATR
jgi:transcriptional regulator with XRE-family HTH domain